MNRVFNAELHMPRVVFGAGTIAQVGAEVERLGARRAVVLSTPDQADSAERVARLLGARSAGVFARATMHVPIEVAREARSFARGHGADCAVAIGGGSTTGLGKAIALDSGLPIVAIPTTYAGSEMTPIYGLTDAGVKKTGSDIRVMPRTVIYDPELTLGLPPAISVASGLNAIAHAAEGLYAHNGNPVITLMAEEGIRALAQALPVLRDAPNDVEARTAALRGAWLCGVVLGHVAMGLHHKLCHTLGGSFNLPHAEVHAVVLPYALAFNATSAPDAMLRIACALGAAGDEEAPAAMQSLARVLGVPTSLQAIGMPADGLDRAADLAVTTPYPNPRPLDRTALRALLQAAHDGTPPSVDRHLRNP